MYEFATNNPTHAMAAFVAMLPPRRTFAEASYDGGDFSEPKGSPISDFDFYVKVVLAAVLLIGIFIGVVITLAWQGFHSKTIKTDKFAGGKKHRVQDSQLKEKLVEVLVTAKGDCFHSQKDCFALKHASTIRTLKACAICSKE